MSRRTNKMRFVKVLNKAMTPNRGQCYISFWALITISALSDSKWGTGIAILLAIGSYGAYVAKSSVWRS